MNDPIVYREKTPNAPWVRVVLWGALGGTAVGILLGLDGRMPALGRFGSALAVVSLIWLFESFLGGLLVELHRDRIRVGLGNGKLFKKTIAYGEIEGLRSVTYRPLREFGGWGVRFSGSKQAWTARGNQAVVLEMGAGKELYIGSDHPRRLEERIRTVAGERLGGRPSPTGG